jgi:hypothetical protein
MNTNNFILQKFNMTCFAKILFLVLSFGLLPTQGFEVYNLLLLQKRLLTTGLNNP